MLKTRGQKIFSIFNIQFMIILSFIMLYPFWYTIIYSLNDGNNSVQGGMYWWPRVFTIDNYIKLFEAYNIRGAYIVTLARVAVGPILTVSVTLIIAYAMNTPGLLYRKIYTYIIIIPMFFSGGLIPYFLNIQNLGLYNNFWVYIFPRLFVAWNFLMMHAYMNNVPYELQESARIDGAGELTIVFRIILPICLPICACLLLFEAVSHWNAWFDSYIFNDRPELYTMQLTLKNVIANIRRLIDLIEEQGKMMGVTMSPQEHQMFVDNFRASGVTNESVLAAASIISIGPIIFLYPFLQRYFIKGIMIGSLKG